MKEITVTLKPAIYFSNAKVGDDVFCTMFGIGKIKEIYPTAPYRINVTFLSGAVDTYTENGHIMYGRQSCASLYYFNPERQEVLYSRPESEINWAEYEEKEIEVRNKDGERWRLRTLWKYAPKFSSAFICYPKGDVNFAPVVWQQARLIKEDS